MTNERTRLIESPVGADEIDELGHLSVPFYEARAIAACQKLAQRHRLDIARARSHGIEFTLVDAYLRNLREQFLGAPLLVRGGVLAVSETRLQCYQELINTETDELSATFVYTFELQRQTSREPLPLPDEVIESATDGIIPWPEHGRPRTIDLKHMPAMPDLATLQQLDLALNQPFTIDAEACDETGLYLAERFSHLPYSGERVDDPGAQWVFETADGHRLGMADLESRQMLFSLPRAGERVQAFRAEVDIGRKTFYRNHWVYSLDSVQLISFTSLVSVALDLDARRAVEIPQDMRAALERRYHPELR